MSAAAIARVGPQRRALPGGWRWVRLREICGPDRQIVAAQDPRVKALPYLSLEHIEAATGRILKAPGSTEEQARSTTFAFDRRHVLYGKLRPYLNKVALPPFAGRCTTELIPLLPGDQVDRAFLSWVLRRRETVEAAMRDRTGSRMPRASLEELLRLEVPLPPLPEQRRIVAVLDEHMGVIEKGRAAAHAQLEAARALPGAYLRQVFSSSEADQWPKRRLGEIAEIVSGITLGRRLGERPARLVPYLRVANVKDGRLDLSDVYETRATEDEIHQLRLQYGDLLLTEGGDPDKLGRGTFWEAQLPLCLHQNHIFRVRCDPNQFSHRFLAAQVSSAYGKRYFLAHGKQTTGIATINRRVLAGLPVMAPSLAIQDSVVEALQSKLEESEKLRWQLEDRMQLVEQLPPALLREAFSGGL